jgi:L-lactate utilization protein LutC
MAKLFKIAVAPTFKSTVKVPRVGGDPLDVQFEFKTMDRKQLAKVYGAWEKATKEMIQEANDKEWSLEEWADSEIALQVSQLKDVVVGWNFDDEFNDENIEALVSSSISVTSAITEVYNEAYVKAKSGN